MTFTFGWMHYMSALPPEERQTYILRRREVAAEQAKEGEAFKNALLEHLEPIDRGIRVRSCGARFLWGDEMPDWPEWVARALVFGEVRQREYIARDIELGRPQHIIDFILTTNAYPEPISLPFKFMRGSYITPHAAFDTYYRRRNEEVWTATETGYVVSQGGKPVEVLKVCEAPPEGKR